MYEKLQPGLMNKVIKQQKENKYEIKDYKSSGKFCVFVKGDKEPISSHDNKWDALAAMKRYNQGDIRRQK